MGLTLRISLSFLVSLLSSNVIGLETGRSVFSQRCIDLCNALVRGPTLRTSCDGLCGALQAQEGEPCIQALADSPEEKIILLSYSSGHYMETSGILAGATQETNLDDLSFIRDMRLNDRGSPATCNSINGMHYCLVQDASMSLGLCLPEICAPTSIAKILANISSAASNSAYEMAGDDERKWDAAPSEQASFTVVCGAESRLDADAGTILTLVFVCFLFSLATAGTILDFRHEAQPATNSQKHFVVGGSRPRADVHLPSERKHLVDLGSTDVARVSGNGEDQHDAPDPSSFTLQDNAPLLIRETPIAENQSAGTSGGDQRASSPYGACGAPESSKGAPGDLLLDSSASSRPHSMGRTCQGDPSWWIQCLMCFSVRRNMGKLLAPPPSSNAFGALEGVRTLSNLWVMLLHVPIFSLLAPGGGLTNRVDVLPVDGHGALASVPAQVINQGNLAVDTFFLMSGFLASVTLLPLLPRVQSGSASLSSWVLGRYWHRYLRLMPTTVFITLVIWQLYPLASDGPTWWPFAAALKESCGRDWWTEVTFVQNLIPWPMRPVPCMVVSWSLGLEMQFFILAVPLIALFHYRPRASVVTLLSIMAAGCLYTLWLGFDTDIRFPLLQLVVADPASLEAWDEAYMYPLSRCPVYIIGVLGGMAWHTHLRWRMTSSVHGLEGHATDRPLGSPGTTLLPIAFLTSALLMSLPVFGAYWANQDAVEAQIPAWADHLYLAFSRPAWASGVALMCGLCFCGQGGVVNWFLTLPVWSPLSRLTFCSYLIHVPLLLWLLMTRSVPFRYTTYEVIITFFGIAVATFVASAVVHLLVEAPFRNLESWARRHRAARKASEQ